MLDARLVQVNESPKNLGCVASYFTLIKRPLLGYEVCQTCFHLLHVDAKELIEHLATIVLYNVLVLESLVPLDFITDRVQFALV